MREGTGWGAISKLRLREQESQPASPEPGEDWELPLTPALPPCRLVEEFMLLANMAVAHKIHRAFPEQALLRRHPPPQTRMLSDLEEFCDQMGLPMDISSASTINVSAGSPGRERPCLGKRRAWEVPQALCSPAVPLQPELPCKREGRPWVEGL